MTGQQIHRLSFKLAILLSFTALITVLTGYTHPPMPDEGTAAHIFQLAIVALFPVILVFFLTADWKQPLKSVRPLAIPGVAVVLAFAALFYLEHYFYLGHYR
ncbi:MAG: hypothetical protein WBQ61_03880 [Candidatus Acidiferrum sp.]